uniref:ATP synthase subunit a n=1 Tax=Bathydorus laniger TaxID=1503680 RepID=A0A0K0KNQ5_9METZ|nr:ATP synthase F0 subunit 6 [Bathydorus laniger]
MNASYFNQFHLKKILYIKTRETIIRIRNLTLTLTIILLLIITLNKRTKILPNRNSIITHMLFTITNNLTHEHIKEKRLSYNPFILSIFTMFTAINLMGLLPYVFTTTSHIIITFRLSLTIIIKTTLRALIRHKRKFFRILTPQSAPLLLAPFLVLIETTRYITRAISLGVRLAANISAGHLLLAILSKFALDAILTNHYILRLIPITALFLIRILEIMVALIQAYVFTLLTTIYLSDTIKLH